MKKYVSTLLTTAAALCLGLAATTATAGSCWREEAAMEGALHHAEALCSYPDSPTNRDACNQAIGALNQAYHTWDQCLAREDQGSPR